MEELVEGGKPEAHLRFDTVDAQHFEIGRVLGRVVQEGALSDARLTPEDECAASSVARGGKHVTQRSLFLGATDESGCPHSLHARILNRTSTESKYAARVRLRADRVPVARICGE